MLRKCLINITCYLLLNSNPALQRCRSRLDPTTDCYRRCFQCCRFSCRLSSISSPCRFSPGHCSHIPLDFSWRQRGQCNRRCSLDVSHSGLSLKHRSNSLSVVKCPSISKSICPTRLRLRSRRYLGPSKRHGLWATQTGPMSSMVNILLPVVTHLTS